MSRRLFRPGFRPLPALLALALSAAGPPPARAEAPRFDAADLFEAGTGGYAHYRIPGIVVTPKGTLLAYCEARRSVKGDWGTIDILMRRSTDGGATWDAPRKVATPPAGVSKNPVALAQKLATAGEITLNNPVAVVDPHAGAVVFLYCVEYARCFARRSVDDGRTFSDPVEITPTFARFRPEYDWKVLATGPGHGVALAGGRLLVPVWLSTGTGGHGHRPSAVSVIVSDDHGATWDRGAIVAAHPNPVNPSETAAVELSDGRVMLNIRHESAPHLRAVTVSRDGSSGWSPLRYDPRLPEPVCFGSLARLGRGPGSDRDRILFANPHNPDDRARKNLTVKVSEDDARTWAASRTIEPGPSGYCDLAVGPDGTIACFYECGTAGAGATNPRSLRLARFNLAWLTSDGAPARPAPE